MKFFMVEILADYGEGDYCFTDKLPQGIGVRSYRLAEGIPIVKDYPEDPWEVSLQLGDVYLGLQLPSLIGNTSGLLIVHRDVGDLIKQYRIGKIEILPFTLYDHKRRIHSKEYVFVNPLGTFDCLNEEFSELKRADSGKILRIKRLVLDREKIKNGNDLFRMKEMPDEYIFSEPLVEGITSKSLTNFIFNELEQR